jgi:uncharacterized transporter YbjL
MLIVIAVLIIGLIVGIILRSKNISLSKIDLCINISIYLLLFTLGLKAGSDESIVKQLHNLGITSLIISIFTITGSVILSWITYHFFFKKIKK